jgi:adenylylsulfate kinase
MALAKNSPYCLWITGMPNAGKSTITYYLLQKCLRNCIVIDGDKFREHITPELSFSREAIIENNKRAIRMINYLMGEGFNVIVAMITPFQEIRDLARASISNYLEVYAKCPEEVRRLRPNYMASDITYEEPVSPDVVVETDKETIEESMEKVLKVLR